MNPVDDMEREPAGDDIVAAEYVLGLQPLDERRATAARIDGERAFAAIVHRWEKGFSALAVAYPETPPPDRVKSAIDRALFASALAAGHERMGLWQNLAFWRGLALASVAAAAILTALPFADRPAQVEQQQLVASLAAAEDSGIQYLAVYDAPLRRVSLSHVSGERVSGRDLELWMIVGDAAPVSLGVVPSGDTAKISLDEQASAKLAAGAVLAISNEPAGGSPTGQPTGPVVAAGDLRNI